jgi:thermostable 8-oxoguanine DNA glycosylase
MEMQPGTPLALLRPQKCLEPQFFQHFLKRRNRASIAIEDRDILRNMQRSRNIVITMNNVFRTF